MTDLWRIDYERAFSEFYTDRQAIGDAAAITEFSSKMQKLGIGQPEIASYVAVLSPNSAAFVPEGGRP